MALLIPDGDTLVTYYILPLIDLNKKSFARKFVASYISQDATKVYVEFSGNMRSKHYKNTPQYVSEVVVDGTLFAIFAIPHKYYNDVRTFIRGDYSKMSKRSKNKILALSTLPYNRTMGSFKMSHPLLQALDKTKTLRKFLKDTLNIDELSPNGELIDAPWDEWFIENRFNISLPKDDKKDKI